MASDCSASPVTVGGPRVLSAANSSGPVVPFIFKQQTSFLMEVPSLSCRPLILLYPSHRKGQHLPLVQTEGTLAGIVALLEKMQQPLILAAVLSALLLCLVPKYKADALLLSDLPTPSCVLDVRALRKRHGILSSIIPSLRLPGHDVLLRPCGPETESEFDAQNIAATYDDTSTVTLDLTDKVDEAALAYFHASVVTSRGAVDDENCRAETFLAELDLPPSFCGSDGARLVLGLANHHVGSYYWARSAGAGSSMDAIGVKFTDDGTGSDKGILCWEDEGGFIASNSNDGKRSEWCNFLRPGDQVQLVPRNDRTGSSGEIALMTFLERFGHVYGVSAEGRPMGSEPKVVYRWVSEKYFLEAYDRPRVIRR